MRAPFTDEPGAIRMAKDVVDARISTSAKPHTDMLGSFVAKGLTYDEIMNETFLQM
jgi:hypothetical protein